MRSGVSVVMTEGERLKQPKEVSDMFFCLTGFIACF